MEEIVQLVQNLGFPIACVIALYWKSIKDTEAHKAESDKFTQAINNNTLAITKLTDKMDAPSK